MADDKDMVTSEVRKGLERAVLAQAPWLAPADLKRLSNADLALAYEMTLPGARWLREVCRG